MPPSPSETLERVNKWVVDNVNNTTANCSTPPRTKKDWNDSFLIKSKKLSNVEEGASFAGDLFHLIQLSRIAMNQFESIIKDQKSQIYKLKDVKQETTVQCSEELKTFIASEIHAIVPAVMEEIESKLQKKIDKEVPVAPQREQIKHQLIIEQEDGSKFADKQSWAAVVKSNTMQVKLQDIPVDNSYLTRDGTATMTFPTVEARDKAANILKPDYKVVSESKPLKKLNPKIKLLDVPEEIFEHGKEEIAGLIKTKNPKLSQLSEEEFKVIFQKKEDSLLVIQTTPNVRKIIKNDMNDQIYLGLKVLHVRDHIHLVQCFHCQEFGHYANSDYCKLKGKAGVCLYCASREHVSKDCPSKRKPREHGCINCTRENRPHNHHKSADPLCPIVIKETLRIYSKTDGMDQESKNYYLRKIERLREQRSRA